MKELEWVKPKMKMKLSTPFEELHIEYTEELTRKWLCEKLYGYDPKELILELDDKLEKMRNFIEKMKGGV